MTNDVPLVSVLMTAYNREKYIGEAIESVLASTYKNIELIVVDDCSTDKTEKIAKSYVEKDNRVKYYKNEENLGDYPNRNVAASYANGKYFKYLDSDDVIYPHGLEVMVTCMECYSGAGFGLSQNAFENGPQPVCLEPNEAYIVNFLKFDLFGRAPGSSIISSFAFNEIGGFTGASYVGDQELWLTLSRTYPLVTMPRDLVWDRMHGEQEKVYEMLQDTVRLRWNLEKEALEHENCPLNIVEKKQAFNRLRAQQRKSFWRILFRSGGAIEAFRYRSKVELDWLQVFSII